MKIFLKGGKDNSSHDKSLCFHCQYYYDKLVFSGFYIILNLVFPIYLLYMYGTIDLDTINDCLKKDKGITMFIYLFVLLFGTALTIYIFIYLLKTLGGK